MIKILKIILKVLKKEVFILFLIGCFFSFLLGLILYNFYMAFLFIFIYILFIEFAFRIVYYMINSEKYKFTPKIPFKKLNNIKYKNLN